MTILDEVKWSRGILSLAKHSFEIDKTPAILLIRHSAREFTSDIKDDAKCSLTNEGRLAAYDLGTKLNPNKNYRIYHSPINRCKDTAQNICEGLRSQSSSVKIMHAIPNFINLGGEKDVFVKYFKRDDVQTIANWFAGFYPSWEFEPALHVAQRGARDLIKNFQTCQENTIDLYVGHDLTVLSYLYYWGGIWALNKWINFLDGFFLHLKPDTQQMQFYFNEKTYLNPMPHWWPNLRKGA